MLLRLNFVESNCQWRLSQFAAFLALFVAGRLAPQAIGADPHQIISADVIIAGGSTAALAAAFAAAEEGAQTVLLEPTDWIGGQLTASGVPAVDEAWHKIRDANGDVLLDVAAIARDPRNMTPAFRDILDSIGNPGRGWVSRFCFEPKLILNQHFEPWERRLAGHLRIYRDTVVKRVERVDQRIVAIHAIRRIPKKGIAHNGYDRLPSRDLADWYDPSPSERFDKEVIRFAGNDSTVFIEATEWGELLALAGVEFLQGVDRGGSPVKDGDLFGQATVYGFVQKLHASQVVDAAPKPEVDRLGRGRYEGREDVWNKIWTYRRIRSTSKSVGVDDLCLQNWGYSVQRDQGGNDYPDGYLFLSKAQTEASIEDWQGGVNLSTLAAAEQRAFAWHHWFKRHTPPPWTPEQLTIEPKVLGTGHGLSKLPYVRDTRRAIGIDGFVLRLIDLAGNDGDNTGTNFPDAVAIGAYPADVHPLRGYEYPPEMQEHVDTRPYVLPLRALTHRDLDNVLVAGKTMAQSFMANSATRLHPIEWSTGTAAGVIAAWMHDQKLTARQALERYADVRDRIAQRTPLEWHYE